jgi:integrase
VKPSTLVTREAQLLRFASALVARGRDPQSIQSLADLITLDAFTEGLRFFIERADGKPGSGAHAMAKLLKSIARHMYQVDETTLAKMAKVVNKLEVKRIGMTAKNRNRLRPFDDPAKVSAFLAVPDRLRAEADSGMPAQRIAAIRAQLAVAISILQMAPMRIGKLAAIDLDKHLVRVGARVHLVIPAEDVKNDRELEFILPEPTQALIDWYRREHRPLLVKRPSSALFPGEDGGPKCRNLLGLQIKEHLFRLTGLIVNAHLFRHLGGKLYLDHCPGQYEVVRRVLGHKSLTTTTNIYTGAEGKAAVEHYDEVILSLRARKATAANDGVIHTKSKRSVR